MLGSVNGSITQPGISRENRSLNLNDISLWSSAKSAQYTECHRSSLLFSSPRKLTEFAASKVPAVEL